MDETGIFFASPNSKTVVKRGSKWVVVATNGQDKQRATCVLAITSNGIKL